MGALLGRGRPVTCRWGEIVVEGKDQLTAVEPRVDGRRVGPGFDGGHPPRRPSTDEHRLLPEVAGAAIRDYASDNPLHTGARLLLGGE